DDGARPHEALTYRLVEVETDGDVTTYGPYEVIAAQPLPLGYGANASATGQQYARTPSVARPSQVFQSATGFFTPLGTRHDPPSRLRIEVVDTGLYRIEAADIAAGVGVSETQAYALIRSRGVSLTNRGRSVAYLQAADFSGLYFYGTAIESNYTSVNVYWLTLGRGTPIVADIQTSSGGQYGPVGTRSATTTTTTRYRGSRRTTTTTSVTSSTTTSTIPVVTTRSFVERLHVEEDSFSAEGSFHDPEADFWLWDYLVGGNAALGHKEFSFECPQALSGVSLKVRLQGLTSLGIPNEHHVVVGLNGVVLGETSWGGAVAREASFSIPAGALLTGANEVELTALRDDGVWMSMVGVDSFDLAYERTTQAVGDRLSLDLSSSGPVEVTGLGSTEVWVLNVSDPFVPRIVSSSTFADDAGTVGVTFTPVRPGKHYVATVAAVLHPIAMTPATATTPGDRSLDADYLVITSPALSDAASRLADYRSSQGLKTAVLTTTEIYDEFNNGIANPQAIRQFLAQTASQRKRSPRYVVFVGEGSFDYKNRLGYGDSIVPPLLIDTEWGLASADVLFGDTQGDDGVPESAVGRIPVSTAEELDAYLDKIRAYETSDGVWRQSVVLAADDADTAGNFAVDSDELADFVPSSSTVIKAYLDRMTLAEARAHVLGGFTDGSLLVNYIGHGGVAMLAAEGLLSVYDAPALAGSGPELPILTAFTCGVGKYELPGVDGLAEALLTTEAGGAIAVYSPTTVEENSDSVLLGTLFYQSLFGSASTVVLGDALLQAQRMGADRGLQPWMLRTYNLLGDPALNVRW
ncbi:MAG: hypothetical protein JW990_02245, partial [Thermoleophilia bacterium]|nr:hypothetical protein [Thermoleophilia bacterium]